MENLTSLRSRKTRYQSYYLFT